jgi:hypothetical protein
MRCAATRPRRKKDFAMQGMSGAETALAAGCPGIPILFFSPVADSEETQKRSGHDAVAQTLPARRACRRRAFKPGTSCSVVIHLSAEAVAVNAIAIGSQHKTMSAISHRIARSDDPKKWPSPQISASTTALTSLAVPQAGVRRPHIAGTAGGTECIEVGQAFEKSCLIDRPLRRAKHSKGVTLLRREAYYRLCSRLQPSRKWPNAANG